MIWQDPTNCINDCYCCMVKTVGFNAKNKHFIKYPNDQSHIRGKSQLNLGLSKVNSQLLASRLKEKNALAPGTNITFSHARKQEFLVYFDEQQNQQ